VIDLGLEPSLLDKWPGLQSVVRVERQREVKSGLKAGQKSHRVWFYLSSFPPNDAILAQTIRAHWSIENQAHWILDVVFDEDRCRTRRDHAPYNLALLRRIALNLIRQNQGKNSLQAMRKAVSWNQELLTKILQTPIALF
jgi:predicted transposase YbfD/YdcC